MSGNKTEQETSIGGSHDQLVTSMRDKFSQWLMPSGRAVSLIEVASELVG